MKDGNVKLFNSFDNQHFRILMNQYGVPFTKKNYHNNWYYYNTVVFDNLNKVTSVGLLFMNAYLLR